VPVLGERLEPTTVLFSLAVIAIVFVGKRMPAGTPISSAANPSSARASSARTS